MSDLVPVSLGVLPNNVQASTSKCTLVILWSLYKLRLEVHNTYLQFRIIQVQFESDNGFDLDLWQHVIIQERDGATPKACSLSLISSFMIISDSLQSQPGYLVPQYFIVLIQLVTDKCRKKQVKKILIFTCFLSCKGSLKQSQGEARKVAITKTNKNTRTVELLRQIAKIKAIS